MLVSESNAFSEFNCQDYENNLIFYAVCLIQITALVSILNRTMGKHICIILLEIFDFYQWNETLSLNNKNEKS